MQLGEKHVFPSLICFPDNQRPRPLVIRSFLRNDSFLPRLGDQRILRRDPDKIRDSGKSDRSRSIRSYEQLDRDYKEEKEGRPPARFARNTMNSKARRGVLLFRY